MNKKTCFPFFVYDELTFGLAKNNIWKLFHLHCSKLVSHWANPFTTTALIPVDDEDDYGDGCDDDVNADDCDDIKLTSREKLSMLGKQVKS